MKLSHASRWLLASVIIVGVAGRIITGLLVYTRLAYAGVLLLGGAAALAYLSVNGLNCKRTTRTARASVGDVFEEHYEIRKDAWPGCAWMEVLNQSNLQRAGGSRLFTRIGAHQLRYYSARTTLTNRGAYQLGPTVLTTGDPFGIFSFHREFPSKDNLIVLPMTFSIDAFPLPAGILPGGKTIHQRTPDVTPHVAEVREYVPGDPMRRIHWPVTAHRGEFMVKEFEQDPQADIWLFLDAYRPAQASVPESEPETLDENIWLRHEKVSLPCDTFEYAVSATASLATYFLSNRRMVGLASSAGRFTVVPAERGERQINKVLETLAFLQPEGVLPINGLVDLQARLLPLGSSVILITPSTRQDLLLAVDDLLQRHLRPAVVLIKPQTFGGRGGSDQIAGHLSSRNIPVAQIGFRDDLGKKLSLAATSLNR